MAVNKVVFGSETLIDLTSDTVTADKILSGYTAHDKKGEAITGSCGYDANTSDATASASEILYNKTAYVSGVKITGSMPNRGAVTGSISTKNGTYQIQQGYHDGSGSVGISSTEKAKIIAENIRDGVTILGVTGTMSGSESEVPYEFQSAIVPTTSAQEFNPPEGYTCYRGFTVAAITYSATTNAAGGTTISIA